jgi:hypothetical protein
MKNKFSIAMSLAVVLAILLTSLALADTIQTDGDTLVASLNPSVNDCTVQHTFSGSSTISYAGGQHFASGATLTVTVTADPGISASGPASTTLPGWDSNGDAHVFSGISTTVPAGVASGTYKVNVTVTGPKSGDNGGDTHTASDFFNVNVTCASAPPPPSDTTAPVITPNVSGTLGNNGWYTSDVTVSWLVVDNESAVSSSSGCGPTTINTDTAGTTLTCSATSAGGTNSQSVTIKRDATVPTISGSASPAPNGAGWNNTNVSVSFTCGDNLSGVASCGPNQTLSSEGTDQSASGTAVDNAGNSATATVSGIDIDKTAPALNISGAASGTSSVCSALPSKPTFAPSDNLSDIASQSDSWTIPSAPSGVGTYTYNATATDFAGNTTSETRTYTVNYSGAFSGYLQPINTDGSSRFKLSSTIPVKFQLTCNGIPISNAVAKLYVAKGDSQPDPGVDEAISTAASTTGNLFRYDSAAQQYIFNLSTKLGYTNPGSNTITSFSMGTWTLKIGLDDGTWQSVNVQLPR